jgi:hypothetical protein
VKAEKVTGSARSFFAEDLSSVLFKQSGRLVSPRLNLIG